MKYIELTQGQRAVVDDEDFDELNQFKWHALYLKKSGVFYASRQLGAKEGKRRGSCEYMHRRVMRAKVDQIVDHRDRDTLNNMKENLRLCTKSQNGMNRGKTMLNTTGRKGVGYDARFNKFFAQIRAGGKNSFLGYTDSLDGAAALYDEAATRLHGEFALTNVNLASLAN